MNEADIPIDIHILKLQDWLVSRRLVPKNIQKELKTIREKIGNALKDLPEHAKLRDLLTGTNINYYHCKEMIEILKETEKDTKSVFGTYRSQRMQDWQEIIKIYENDNIYLAEAAQIYVRNINWEIPGMRKQMIKLEQQTDECLKQVQDLSKPEAHFLAEHAALLKQLGVKGENLREEFMLVLSKLPEMYQESISSIADIQKAINFYIDCYTEQEGKEQVQRLPILRHLVEFGNTTIYQYVHKEAPLNIEEPPFKLNLTLDDTPANKNDNAIDFGEDDNNGTSSSISAEMIDFGTFGEVDGGGSGDGIVDLTVTGEGGNEIDWGIEVDADNNNETSAVEINFDIPIEEYGIVVERVGVDGGVAKGEQAYTILDSPAYRDRFLDELYELEAFLRLRLYEQDHADATAANFMYSLLDSISTFDSASIRTMINDVENILQKTQTDQTRHLFQLKHSPKYANLLAGKLRQMFKAVDKIRANKETLKVRAAELKEHRQSLNPLLDELISQTKRLQNQIAQDISKRYKNRIVNLLGGIA